MFVKSFLISVILLVRQYKWFIQARKEKRKLNAKEFAQSFGQGTKLVILPHVDDEWMGCSQILQNYNNVKLVYANMTGGDTPIIHKKRRVELNGVAERFGCKIIELKDEKSTSLCNIIISQKASYIFIPNFIDWHEEHIETMKILRDALCMIDAEKRPYVVTYQVSVPILSYYVTHAIPMDKSIWKNKWELFPILYPTQKHIPYKRFALQEYVNGAISGSYSAEVFSQMTADEWILYFDKMILPRSERERILLCLDDINKLRDLLKTY